MRDLAEAAWNYDQEKHQPDTVCVTHRDRTLNCEHLKDIGTDKTLS
jgi:hypothetical protein